MQSPPPPELSLKPAPKTKPKAKKIWPAKLGKEAKTGKNGNEFSGQVESVQVKSSAQHGYEYRFDLINKKGDCRSYMLDPSNPTRLHVFTNLLNASLATKSKMSVVSVLNANGPDYATEMEIRVKR